jgi:hypothetical protein
LASIPKWFVTLKTRNFRVLCFWDIILQNNIAQLDHRTVTEKEQSLIIISRWAIFGIYKCIHHASQYKHNKYLLGSLPKMEAKSIIKYFVPVSFMYFLFK